MIAGLAVRPGAPAPDFTLPSTEGGTERLSRHRGETNVLLAFFPGAFTTACTAEMCAFSDDLDQFTSAGTHVYGVSVDSLPTLVAFRKAHGIGIHLLSDFTRAVCRGYGTLDEERFSSRRAYVLVDRDGAVRWTYVESDLDHRRETTELLAQIRKLAGPS
jgi:peroxiredoxin